MAGRARCTTARFRAVVLTVAIGSALLACRGPVPPRWVVPEVGSDAEAGWWLIVELPPPPAPAAPTSSTDPPRCPTFRVPADILFEFASSEVGPAGAEALADVARQLIELDTAILVIGHTDTIGSESFNDRLSVERAEAVARALIELGVRSELLTTVGRGWHDPIATNDTPRGQARNRRVEIGPDPDAAPACATSPARDG